MSTLVAPIDYGDISAVYTGGAHTGKIVDGAGRNAKGANRLATDLCTGHTCWPPRLNDEASPDVFVNGIAQHRQTDHWVVHCCPPCHDGFLDRGSPTVFVNGLEAGRIGDPVTCGSFIMEGSPNVFIGP